MHDGFPPCMNAALFGRLLHQIRQQQPWQHCTKRAKAPKKQGVSALPGRSVSTLQSLAFTAKQTCSPSSNMLLSHSVESLQAPKRPRHAACCRVLLGV